MNGINRNKMGLAVGSLTGFWHLLWSVIVATGHGQKVVDFIFQLHFVQPPFTVAPFNFVTAAELVVVTFMSGYVLGWLFGTIWNRLHKTG